MLSHALAATSAQASGPLGGQPVAVPTAPAVVQQAAEPVLRTARTAVATVRETTERSAVAPVIAPVAHAPAAVRTTVTAAATPSPKPAAPHTVRHRRGGATVARAASATPAHTAKRAARQRSAVATPALPVSVAAVAEHSAAPQTAAPHRTPRAGSVVPDRAPEPATTSTATATAAGPTAGSAAAVLALLALLTLAFSRLGALLGLPKGWAPMPPLLATPERPG